jgi:SAM-dependent methyltransferase
MAVRHADAASTGREALRRDYEVEKELAGRLRNAPPEERRRLYASVYDEFYRRVPNTPQVRRKVSPEQAARKTAWQLSLLNRYLDADTTFLEIGPGDCALAFAVASRVRRVYAVDVSAEITRNAISPANFALILSDGCSIPVPPRSVDVAYSEMLMEHLHPDDALEQLTNIYAALAPGGVYLCITPNRLTGPHDISKHFDTEATGFHMKEYTVRELSDLLRRAGFARIRMYVGRKGVYAPVPLGLVKSVERAFAALPLAARRWLAHTRPFSMALNLLLDIRLAATK